MAKQVWVSRRVGKYRVGAWVPAKLIGLGYLLFIALGIYGLILVHNADSQSYSASQRPLLITIVLRTFEFSHRLDSLPTCLSQR